MAPDGQTLAPNVYDAEPIPEAARAEIDRLLTVGRSVPLYRARDAPVALLEAEFADLMGARYALAVSSCSAALFLSLKALDLPRGREGADPGLHLCRRSLGRACMPIACRCWSRWATITASTWRISPPSCRAPRR